jgi:hypothetical protein
VIDGRPQEKRGLAPCRFNAGFASIRTVFWIVFLGVTVYAGFIMGIPQFTNLMLEYDVESEAENAHHYTDEEIRKRVLEKANYWNIPLEEENMQIERNAFRREITIALNYEVTLNFFNRYERTLYYDIRVEKPLKAEGLR